MILRITLFISLLTIFYFYCQNDNQPVQSGSEGGFLPEAPIENSPANQYDLIPGKTTTSDSSINYVTVSQSLFSEDQLMPDLVAQN
jgi:hypothetical protein